MRAQLVLSKAELALLRKALQLADDAGVLFANYPPLPADQKIYFAARDALDAGLEALALVAKRQKTRESVT